MQCVCEISDCFELIKSEENDEICSLDIRCLQCGQDYNIKLIKTLENQKILQNQFSKTKKTTIGSVGYRLNELIERGNPNPFLKKELEILIELIDKES